MANNFKRKYIQLISALVYNANIKGFANGELYHGQLKSVCVPGLNCYSCPGAIASCPLGSLQNAVAVSGKRLPFYVVGTLLLFGVILGRTICGFLCPFGLIQELLHKIPLPKVGKSNITRKLSYLKYIILAVFVIIIPLAAASPEFCKYICPAGTLEGGIPIVSSNEQIAAMTGTLFNWKIFVLAVILIGSVFVYRGFCRFICPLGAIYSFFNRISVLGMKVDEDKCVHCGKCVELCKMDILKVGDRECIACGECIKVCGEKAICRKSLKSGR
ncbi:MAG: 4Fe-4S binding protein [Clostridiales bacterium]|nr:4Fe-4S binding protein [Clostridiales bacterium]